MKKRLTNKESIGAIQYRSKSKNPNDLRKNKEAIYWRENWYKYKNWIKSIRKGSGNSPLSYMSKFYSIDWQEKTIKDYGLRGIEYGRWLNNWDKIMYTIIIYSAFNDLNTILKLKNKKQIGLERLLICFGSRGYKNSEAHFSSKEFYININRYKRPDKAGYTDKSQAFEKSQSKGSLAHEYGHWLDVYTATFFDAYPEKNKSYYSLSGNDQLDFAKSFYAKNKNKVIVSGKPAYYVQRFIYDLTIKEDGTATKFSEKMKKYLIEKGLENKIGYYFSPVEIWARSFESYVFYVLNKKGIINLGLTHEKKTYSSPVYPNWTDFRLRKKMSEAVKAILDFWQTIPLKD